MPDNVKEYLKERLERSKQMEFDNIRRHGQNLIDRKDVDGLLEYIEGLEDVINYLDDESRRLEKEGY